MAEYILTNDVPTPNARGFILQTDQFSPRFRKGNTVLCDDHPPALGDEVLCLMQDNWIAIGELKRIDRDELTLADSCHIRQEPDSTVKPVKHWRIIGCCMG